jgi:cold shock CspA family protein
MIHPAAPMAPPRRVGVVVKWDQVRMFGFIRADRQEFFVHISGVESQARLAVGTIVEFEVAMTARGVRALAVRPGPSSCPKCSSDLSGRTTCRACGFRFGT